MVLYLVVHGVSAIHATPFKISGIDSLGVPHHKEKVGPVDDFLLEGNTYLIQFVQVIYPCKAIHGIHSVESRNGVGNIGQDHQSGIWPGFGRNLHHSPAVFGILDIPAFVVTGIQGGQGVDQMLVGKVSSVELHAAVIRIEEHHVQVVYVGFVGPGSFGPGSYPHVVEVRDSETNLEHYRCPVRHTLFHDGDTCLSVAGKHCKE